MNMSGGSWDYEYMRIEELADRLHAEKCLLRRALADRLRLLSKAMHDIEWVDSGDFAKGEELPAIKSFLGENYQAFDSLDVITATKTKWCNCSTFTFPDSI